MGYVVYTFRQTNADMIFGGITIVCGIVGTLAGGFVLDYIDSTISNAFKVDNLAFSIYQLCHQLSSCSLDCCV